MKLVAIDNHTTQSIASNNLSEYLNRKEILKYYQLTHFVRQDWLAGRIALKEALNRFFSLGQKHNRTEVQNNKSGIPFIKGLPRLYCSISHSYGFALAGVSEKPIGVDIEKIRFHNPSLLLYIAKPEEIVKFRSVNCKKKGLITKIWTIKEATLKALGLGFKVNPKKINIFKKIGEKDYLVNCEIKTKVYDCVWKCRLLVMRNFCLSVSSLSNTHENIKFDWYKPA